MIIATRYRDVPWEETGCPSKLNAIGAEKWRKWRGTPISVEIPSVGNRPFGTQFVNDSECREPKYRVVKNKEGSVTNVSVCSHIAEIGD